MARLDMGGIGTQTVTIDHFGGQNTAVQFSQIPVTQSPSMVNLLPGRTGSLVNRPGTLPVTLTQAADILARIFPFRQNNVDNILASGGTTLYKFDPVGLDWDPQTMTNALNTPNITSAQFRNDAAVEVMVIADGATLKYYNGTAVANITPAANDTSPLPANVLGTKINTSNPAVGVILHNNRMVVWADKKDIIFHSKPGFYDYFPATSFQRWVRNNDYIQTCISYGSALLVFMRHSVGVLFGDGYSATPLATDWSQDFLDTTEGCVNPRSVQIVVFPDLHEEVFYQTDRGVSSVTSIDTLALDNSSRFATRNVTNNKIDWTALGITNDEWTAASSWFVNGFYWLVFKRGTTWTGMVYDTNSDDWYPIEGVRAVDFYSNVNGFYFLGGDAVAAHLCAFDTIDYDVPSLTSFVVQDFNNAAKSTGTPVSWYWYSKLLNPGMTGFKHLWDILMLECRQFASYSQIDVVVNALQGQYNVVGAVKTQFMIVGYSIIGEAEIANTNFTDFLNNAKRQRIFLKSQYIQIKLSNTLGQPVELFNIHVEVRPQTYQG